MVKTSKRDLRAVLFDAFANPEFCKAQESSVFWAINEGHKRYPTLSDFDTPTARKGHQCVRGCHIQAGDIYFRESNTPSDPIRICACCMAMILFYLEVWKLPTILFDYWDNELNCPHWYSNGIQNKTSNNNIVP